MKKVASKWFWLLYYITILAGKRKVTKWFVYYFLRLNNIFFLYIVNVMYVVLGWLWWRENVLNQRKTSNLNNKPPTEITNPCTIHTKWRNIAIFGKASLLILTNDLFIFNILNVFLALSCVFVQRKTICDEEMLKYSFRTEVQPGSHRLADLWPISSKSNTRLLFILYVSTME